LTIASGASLASCGSSGSSAIKIGVFNSAGWTTDQATLWKNYANYLSTNVTDDDGNAMFEFVYSSTITLAEEVNSFIAQDVDGIMIANTDATTAVEATCAADKVPYVAISTKQTTSTVGANPSEYCLGGMDPYFGDTKEFAKQWLDFVKADMETQGLTTAKISSICFPQGFAPKHDEIIAGIKELIDTDAYSSITYGETYYAGGIPLANYVPSILTQFQTDIGTSGTKAYETNYLIGFANGMGTIVPTLSAQYGVAGQPLEKVKMLAIGYTANTEDALKSYLLTEAEVGVEGFAAGVVELYNKIKGVTYTDAADFTTDGIVNVPNSWFIITGDNYKDFQNYVFGGGTYDFTNYKPNVTATELKSLLGTTSLASIKAITNRTLAEIKAAHQ
jgi:hypothetical protein